MDYFKILSINSKEGITRFMAYHNQRAELLSIKNESLRAIKEGISYFKSKGFVPDLVILSTSTGNKTIENRTGAKVALMTTAGFKDLIQIGRKKRNSIYSLHPKITPHVVTPKSSFEIEERTLYNGKVERDTDKKEVKTIAKTILLHEFESVAVSLINSHLNSLNEKEISAILDKMEIPHTISSDISPEYREYERTSTTLLNAYIIPVMTKYFNTVKSFLEPNTDLKLMQSNGGIIDFEKIKNAPIQTLFSNEVAAIVGVKNIAKKTGYNKLVTVDIGGDTITISVFDEHITLTNQMQIDNLPIQNTSVLIRTIGKGGKAEAKITDDNFLKIDLFPSNTDKSIKLPTLKDAFIHLGYLEGELSSDIVTYFKNFKIKNHNEYIEGIVQITAVEIARKIKNFIARKGFNLSEFKLMFYGQFGGIMSTYIAQELGIDDIIIPVFSNYFANYGMLYANIVKDKSMSVLKVVRPAKIHDFEDLKKNYRVLINELKEELLTEGIQENKMKFHVLMDMRYEGESQELTIPFTESIVEDFHSEHHRLCGYYLKNSLLELVTLRVRAIGYLNSIKNITNITIENDKKNIKTKKIFVDGQQKEFSVFKKETLTKNSSIETPVLIIDNNSTIMVPSSFNAKTDNFENIILTKKD